MVALPDAGHLRPRLVVLASGVFLSLGGPIIRLLDDTTEWQLLFYRALALLAALLALLAARNRGRVLPSFRGAGRNGVLAGLCLGLAFVGFVFSITRTTVANTLFLFSAAPFVAALLAWLLLGERVTRATWTACLVAALGIALMVSDGLVGGGLLADLAALGAMVAFAGFSVLLRRGRSVEMVPAVCVAAMVSATLGAAAAFALGTGLGTPLPEVGLCLVYGAVAMGGGLALYTAGSRSVPAAELTLLSLTEIILGPLWVWLGFGETPSRLTLLGGAVVLAAITGQAASGVVRRPRPPLAVG
jgi:DME family drug/metabolite transporter